MIKEIITLNAEDTKQAETLGADRVELVSAIVDGGLTPSYGTIKNVLNSATIPVQIMVRPHGYGYVYNGTDWQAMKEDIQIIQSLGGHRIVFGCITKEGKVDEALLQKVIDLVPDFDITFHRAFDSLASQIDGYHVLLKYKKHVKRILTSGGKPKAGDATDVLNQLVALSHELDGPEILTGSGVTPDNIRDIHEQVGGNQYHLGSGVRVDNDFGKDIDEEEMNKLIQALS